MLDKIKHLRGALYRKFVEKKNADAKVESKEEPKAERAPTANLEMVKGEELLGFELKKHAIIIELPDMKDLTKINVTYPLIEPFAYANIKWLPETNELIYDVVEPEMTEVEKKLLAKISEAIIELVDVELSSIRETSKALDYLETQVAKVVKDFGLKLTKDQYTKIMYYIYRNFVGYNEIDGFLQDPNIEDISCDGIKTPMYIVHRKYGSLKTNVGYEDLDSVREFLVKLAERCGRYVSYAEPILDGTLPDGSRVSATLAGDVATRGPTFTIRKFSEKPLSPVDQMELNTATPEMLAYLWYLIENDASMLIVGGVATGKTSLLNSISMFIQPEAKIVSIEDTRELRLPHEHWIPGLARVGFGIPIASGEKYGEVSLFDLLRESFRQNPDYVIVGEVRGEEASVMFQGMNSGHPTMSTFHAGSIDTVIKRLTTPPINLSPTLLESLDVVVIMSHAKEKGKSARRINEIVEIVSVDPKTNDVKTNIVYKWDPATDTYSKISESIKVEKVTLAKGGNTEDAMQEIDRREIILEWMKGKGIKDFPEVTKIIHHYYKDPNAVLQQAGAELIIKRPVVEAQIQAPVEASVKQEVEIPIPVGDQKGEKPRRLSMLDLLGGFKIVGKKA